MDRTELRHALYHRLRFLWPWLANVWVRRVLRLATWLLVFAYFLFVILVLGLRYWALPKVAEHQPEIQQAVSSALGMPVRIAQIRADWQGLNPRLTLSSVQVLDRDARIALAFQQVEAVLSWRSLWHLAPIMDLLAVDGPVLHVRRLADGRITVAGVETEGETDPKVIETLLQQRRIRIRNATLVWSDALRAAPPLVLEDVQFGLDNRGARHLFGLSAVPPEHLASRLDLRGELRGDLLAGFDQLTGRIFAELDYVDLAGWRPWVDYPFPMRQGRGAMRVWGDWDEGRGGVTADLALEDVQVKLGKQLSELQLANLRGRLRGRYGNDEWSFAGHNLELATLSGIRLAPTDFQADWRSKPLKGAAAETSLVVGSASATLLDLGALQRLAAYLPLDARSRKLLLDHQPEGRISGLRANWEAEGETLKHYTLKARFDDLGINAAGVFPGGKGLSGEVEASEQGGTLTLSAKDGGIDLPSIFPESFIPLAQMRAKSSWKVKGEQVGIHLERLDFSSPDAEGVARGSYKFDSQGPGEIDLTASISRADGRAVWRYLPHAIGQDTRQWVRKAITQGSAGDAKLVLRGNLRDFPFRQREQGQFEITAKAKDVRLDYAEGWPVIDGLDAKMRFGVGMRIEATAGTINGARITQAIAEIPDLDVSEEQFVLQGKVEGPTEAFLRYIDRSPLVETTDHFTVPMRAQGNGHLTLRLDMPLRHIDASKVVGEFTFLKNQVTVMPGLPPIQNVNGKFAFTDSSITAQELSGQLLGAPMRLAAKSDGSKVQVMMSGGAQAKELRKFLDIPWFDHVSGATNWKGEVVVRKKSTEFVLESNLLGLASTLPEPFTKAANVPMPWRVEKVALPRAPDGAERDQVRSTIKGVSELLVQRKAQGGIMQVERGSLAWGTALPPLPASGMVGDIQLARIDGDFWRRILSPKPASGDSIGAPLPISRLNIRTPQMRLYNRDFNAVDLAISSRDGGWQIGLAAREAAGELFWQGAAGGSLRADLKRLSVPAEAPVGPDTTAIGNIDSLPALDLRVADLVVGDKRLGRLEVKARNHAAGWRLENLLVQNPDGSLKGKGDWRLLGGQQTRLEFELAASDAGKLLERLGYPGTVRRGSANLTGNVSWDGALTNIHYPSLSGDMVVKAENGQFAKLEPGVGKLLGLISLQTIPRRLTLDFRDIFSDGLAFDSIDGKLTMSKGVMRTVDDLRMDGPAARILIRGEADLKQETQDLRVSVQPEVGNAAAVGVAIANPAIGAAVWVVNKVLQNPLNRIMSFQYHVTGSWSDPKVEKLGQPAAEKPGDPGAAEKGGQ